MCVCVFGWGGEGGEVSITSELLVRLIILAMQCNAKLKIG